MILIDGKKAAAELREELKQEVSELKAKHSKVPPRRVLPLYTCHSCRGNLPESREGQTVEVLEGP